MTLLVPNASELSMLRFITGNDTPGVISLRLFNNDVTPAETDTAANYTEPVGGGYAVIALSAVSWTFATADGVSSATYNTPQTFTFTSGPETIYGYTLDDAGGDLLWVESFKGVVNVGGGGGTITITPKIMLE